MKKFKVTYTLQGDPFEHPDYPEYNDGYELTNHEEILEAENEDDIVERFCGSPEIQNFQIVEA